MVSELDKESFVIREIGELEGKDFSGVILEGSPEAIRAAASFFGKKVIVRALSSVAERVGEAVILSDENALEDAAKAAFIKAQSVYRGLHDHLPLKNTWETLTESIRDGWRSIAYSALEAAVIPPLGTQPEPRKRRSIVARPSPSQVAPANPAQVTDLIEDLEQAVVDFENEIASGYMQQPLYTHPAPSGQAVQDTWFTDRALPVKAMSGDVEDNRVLRLHFRRPVTDNDRKSMCDALNLHQASLSQPHPSDERVVEARNYETFRTFAHEATKAITNLTGGGSEYFGKEVDGVFLADLPRCVERLRHRLDRAALSAKECRLDG